MKYVLQTNLSCFKLEHGLKIDNKNYWILVPGDVIEIGNTVDGLTEIYWKGSFNCKVPFIWLRKRRIIYLKI